MLAEIAAAALAGFAFRMWIDHYEEGVEETAVEFSQRGSITSVKRQSNNHSAANSEKQNSKQYIVKPTYSHQGSPANDEGLRKESHDTDMSRNSTEMRVDAPGSIGDSLFPESKAKLLVDSNFEN